MKCWPLRILCLLILGIVTTVGVTWGLAVVEREQFPGRSLTRAPGDTLADWTTHRLEHWPGKPTEAKVVVVSEFGYKARLGIVVENGVIYQIGLAQFGWPAATAQYGYRDDESGPRYFWTYPSHVKLDIVSFPVHRFLPAKLILPGFIFNTLFYAAIWFALFATFGFVRETLRHKRGRSPKCAYDLRVEFKIGCPECGWGRAD